VPLPLDALKPANPFMYQATITITGAEFVNSSGERIHHAAPIKLQAIVGGMVGG
jgi:hypothetical protein